MAEENALGAPPATLTPAEVRERLQKKDVIVDVPGFGPLRYKSLTVAESAQLAEVADKDDPYSYALWGIIRSFPDTFTDADIEWMREADATALGGLMEVVADQSGRGREAANVPLTFRTSPAARKRVSSGKRGK